MIDNKIPVTAQPRTSTAVLRLGLVAGAAVAVLVVWLIARYAAGVHPHSPAFTGTAHPQAVQAGFAVAIAVLAALLGWGLAVLIGRRARRPRRVWLFSSGAVLLVSLAGPLSGHGVPGSDRLALVLMHLAVAAVLIPGYASTLPRSREHRPTRTTPASAAPADGPGFRGP